MKRYSALFEQKISDLAPIIKEQSNSYIYLSNYLLISNAINSETKRLHLQVPKVSKDVCNALLFALFISKYEQNNYPREHHTVEPEQNALFYSHKNGILIYRGKEQEQFVFEKYPKSDGERKQKSFSNMLRLTKESDVKYTANTSQYIQSYQSRVKEYFEGFDIITSFTRKAIIVSNLNLFEDFPFLNCLPIQLGNQPRNLPVEPIIEIFKDASTAFDKIKVNAKSEYSYDFIYIGNGFEEVIEDIKRLQSDNKIAKSFIINSHNIPADYDFKKWAWSRQEIEELDRKTRGNFKKIQIQDDELICLKDKLNSIVEKMIEAGANTQDTNHLVNYIIAGYSNYFIIDSESVFNYQKDWMLGNDDPIGYLLYEAPYSKKKKIQEEILSVLKDFRGSSGKLDWVRKVKNEGFAGTVYKEIYVVARSWQIEELKIKFKSTERIYVVTNKQLRDILKNPTLEIRKEGGKVFWKKRLIVIPHIAIDYQHLEGPLRHYNLYHQARQLGDVAWLYYSDIEEKKIEAFEVLDQRDLKCKLTHTDRSYFLPKYSFEWKEEKPINETVKKAEELLKEIEQTDYLGESQESYACKINDYFSKCFGIWKPKRRLNTGRRDSGEGDMNISMAFPPKTPNEVKFRIWFSGEDYQNLSEYEMIGEKAGRPARGYELTNGDYLIDFDLKIVVIKEPLKKIPEAKKIIMEELDWSQNKIVSWIESIRSVWIQTNKCSRSNFNERLANKLEIKTEGTVSSWMSKKQLPNPDNLEKISNLFLRQTKEADRPRFESEIKDVKYGRMTQTQFLGVLHTLKKELREYFYSKEKGKFLQNFDENDIQNLLNHINRKRIYRTEKL
jgi:hypothetical protein